MQFKTTYFRDFRNIEPQRVDWSPGLNLIAGANGAGKTNFVEGLQIISGWGPLERGTKIGSLIKWDEGNLCPQPSDEKKPRRALLGARVIDEGERESKDSDLADKILEIMASVTTRCSLRLDGKPVTAGEMRRRLPVLAFLPGHMSLLRGGASYRRQLLDLAGAVVDSAYAEMLHNYRRILRQKAVMLKRGGDVKIINKVLAPLGAKLWETRSGMADSIAAMMSGLTALLARPIEIRYVRGGGGFADDAREDFAAGLAARSEKERAAKFPIVGPHRDDLVLSSCGADAALLLSRGQSRRAAAALMIATSKVVESRLGRKPVLVFDEVASELDAAGRASLLSAIEDTGFQIFATTTESNDTDYAIYDVRSGMIKRR